LESKGSMPTEIHWFDIALRLALTMAAGGLLGMERSRTGHPAGLRTTLLVTLAASVAMIQMNLLIETNGKPSDSYTVMDLMRLPLGILTGVGFIGAGAIVRKGEFVIGLTTAATMWFATVVGLCLGGGQLILGSVSTAIGLFVLWGLRFIENKLELYRRARLRITVAEDHLTVQELRVQMSQAGIKIKSLSMAYSIPEHYRTFDCEVRWPATKDDAEIPSSISQLESFPGVVMLQWEASGSQKPTA
jgi:putative Mg2+ transporter-C (MgtC) family protein